jgi:hypothetical protein
MLPQTEVDLLRKISAVSPKDPWALLIKIAAQTIDDLIPYADAVSKI